MCCLQLITRVGHFRYQGIDPIIQFQLKHAAVFGGADVFTLDQFEVVCQAGEQEYVRQTGIDAAVCGCFLGLIQCGFLSRVGGEEAGVIAVFIERQRNKAKLANSNSRVSGIRTSVGIFI